MNPTPNWLQRFLGGARPSADSAAHAADQLELARAHAREGKLIDASRVYSQLCRKSASVDTRVEFARVLLELGDSFGAAAESSRVLEQDPDNAAALEIRGQVVRMEEAERRK